MPDIWTLAFPAPAPMLSVNGGKSHWATSKAKSLLRERMFVAAQQAHLPKGLSRVRIDVELRFPTNVKRDEPNYHNFVGKPLVDAIASPRRYQVTKGARRGQWVVEPGYEMIPDDTSRYRHCPDCPHITFGQPVGRVLRLPYGEIAVTITDMSEVSS
jgi:hypothetical protein